MNEEILKKYIENVYKIEASLYNQRLLFKNVQSEIDRLKSFREDSLIKIESAEGVIDLTAIISTGGLFGIIFVIGYIVINFFKKYDSSKSFFNGLLFAGVIGVMIGVVITLIECLYVRFSLKEQNAINEKRNNEIRVKNEKRQAINKKKLELAEQELGIIIRAYSDTKKVLQTYYDTNIIFPKYRNFVAVSSFYEYISSGRCATLEGHEGAYNIFENELRQNIIIGKLEEVVDKLDAIEQNQYMLYSAIERSNANVNKLTKETKIMIDKLQKIEDNTMLIGYNSKIAAQNTEFLTWVKILGR